MAMTPLGCGLSMVLNGLVWFQKNCDGLTFLELEFFAPVQGPGSMNGAVCQQRYGSLTSVCLLTTRAHVFLCLEM